MANFMIKAAGWGEVIPAIRKTREFGRAFEKNITELEEAARGQKLKLRPIRKEARLNSTKTQSPLAWRYALALSSATGENAVNKECVELAKQVNFMAKYDENENKIFALRDFFTEYGWKIERLPLKLAGAPALFYVLAHSDGWTNKLWNWLFGVSAAAYALAVAARAYLDGKKNSFQNRLDDLRVAKLVEEKSVGTRD